MALARLHNWIAGDVLTALDLNAEFNNIINNTVNTVPLTSLTANSFTYLDANKLLATTAAPTNGQLLVGSTGTLPVAAALTGTANQVVVTNGAGTITLSTPQSIAAASSPTFAALTLTAPLSVANGGTGLQTLTIHTLQVGNGTSTPTQLAVGTTGQWLKGVTGADPAFAVHTGPTVQVFTSGTAATYTTPTGCVSIKVRLQGPGGGGAGSGTAPGAAGDGSAASTFSGSSLSAGPGTKAVAGAGGAGGGSSGGDVNLTGATGESINGLTATGCGGDGASSPFGGRGAGGTVGVGGGAAQANTGSGGGGGGSNGTASLGGSGGAGGYVEKWIASPAGTYTYTIGTGGTAGTAGGGGTAGGAGAAGLLIVEEYY